MTSEKISASYFSGCEHDGFRTVLPGRFGHGDYPWANPPSDSAIEESVEERGSLPEDVVEV
jgi:hypothetical protein